MGNHRLETQPAASLQLQVERCEMRAHERHGEATTQGISSREARKERIGCGAEPQLSRAWSMLDSDSSSKIEHLPHRPRSPTLP